MKILKLQSENDWSKNIEEISYLDELKEQFEFEIKDFELLRAEIFKNIDRQYEGMQLLFEYAIKNKIGVFGD